MQSLTAPPRDTLTEAAIVALLRDSSAVTIGFGCELVDRSLNVLEDISGDLRLAGEISRNSYATLHGTGMLHLSRELAWGQAILRPYMRLADGVTSARWNLGAYWCGTPARRTGQSPPTYQVQVYDMLLALADSVGESFSVPAGAGYLSTMVDILTQVGYSQVQVDQSAAGLTLPAARSWLIGEDPTWLGIVNDLLAAIGYQGVWSDWDGRLRLAPYIRPVERAAEWVYAHGEGISMLAPEQEIVSDLFEMPNRWVAVRNNNVDGPAPVEGNGIYTYVNQSVGPASVDARGGRVLTRMLWLDAADHASLVVAATESIESDLADDTVVSGGGFPHPGHWHFDRVDLAGHPVLGDARLLGRSWTLPLDGSDMTHEWGLL